MDPVSFTTEDGVRLEGELRMPEGEPRAAAVLCHPHPRHGGSKDHPILWAIRNELAAARGCAVVGFNFRGVMGSGGTYGGGRAEIRDARAAISFAREHVPEAAGTFVVGWSFGANVALREALDDPRVDALALLGIPLRPGDVELPGLPAPSELRALARPVLLLAGEQDVYAPPEEVRAYAAAFPAGEAEILNGTDHYLWRREKEAAALVGAFAERTLSRR
ncbi:MAG TPA: alpha/beta fold hydrolase [Actinomycetota bacterium]|nr:alpha/beta fold hydrolase [Actinomycetota bacterium]